MHFNLGFLQMQNWIAHNSQNVGNHVAEFLDESFLLQKFLLI